MIAQYEADIHTALAGLTDQTAPAALALLALPDEIRGFGPVKAVAMQQVAIRRMALLAALTLPDERKVRHV